MGSLEIELDLLRVHQVEDRDVMLAVTQVLEGIGESFGLSEEVGEDDHKGPLPDFLGDLVECGIDTIAVIPDSLVSVRQIVAQAEG